MGIDYSISVVDWDEFIRFQGRIVDPSLADEEKWDLQDDFYDDHCDNYEKGTQFEDVDLSSLNHSFSFAELYENLRSELPSDQRDLWDRFLATLLPDRFLDDAAMRKLFDVDWKKVDEQTIVALNPESVAKLYSRWTELDLDVLKTSFESGVKDGKIVLDERFEDFNDLSLYIHWLVCPIQYAKENSKGFTVKIAI